MPVAEVSTGKPGRQEPHAAVDVEAHASRRHHAVRQERCGHAADREPIAVVHVRHAPREVDDAGQRGHVHQLRDRLAVRNARKQLLVGEDPRRHAHVRAMGARDVNDELADPNEPGPRARCGVVLDADGNHGIPRELVRA